MSSDATGSVPPETAEHWPRPDSALPPPPPSTPAPPAVTPMYAPPPPPVNPSAPLALPPAPLAARSQAQRVGVIAAAVVVVSAFLPWASVQTIFGSLSVTGFQNGEGDGVLTAIAGVIGGLCVWKGGRLAVVAALAGLGTTAIAIYDWVQLTDTAEVEEFAIVQAGIGLYGTLAGGVALLGTAVGRLRRD